MKNLKSYLAALSLAAALLFVNQAQAVTPPALTFYALGSSAQFNTFGLAAGATIFAGGPLCGTHHWTQKSSSTVHISLSDTRAGSSIVNEDGNIWIVWNDAAAAGNPGGSVCFYLATDSIVGVRGYQASGTLVLPASLVGVADANIVPLLGAGEPLPAQIQSFATGATFNAAATDIRPEDAKFASMRVQSAYGAQAQAAASPARVTVRLLSAPRSRARKAAQRPTRLILRLTRATLIPSLSARFATMSNSPPAPPRLWSSLTSR